MIHVHSLLLVFVMATVTFLLRFIPFVLFPEGKKTPEIIVYLSEALPCAIMGMLVIYCLKDVSLMKGWHGAPEGIGVLIVILLHKWKHNSLLSIAAGTISYMLLVQLVF